MYLEIYKNNELYQKSDINENNDKMLYMFIENLKIDSTFSYKSMNNDIELSFKNTKIIFRGICESNILLKLLSDKVLQFMYKDVPNKFDIKTNNNEYKVDYIESDNGKVAKITLSLGDDNSLTQQSRRFLNCIIDKEFSSWKQTFHAISSKNNDGYNIYYDDKKMSVDNIVFDFIKPVVSENEKAYMNLFDVNPFGRMKK